MPAIDVAVVADHDTREGTAASVRTAREHGLGVWVLSLCDCYEAVADERVLVPEDLGLDPGELGRMATLHDRPGLRRWAAARLVERLVTDGHDVLAIRPGTEVLAPVDPLLPRSAPVALVALAPPPGRSGPHNPPAGIDPDAFLVRAGDARAPEAVRLRVAVAQDWTMADRVGRAWSEQIVHETHAHPSSLLGPGTMTESTRISRSPGGPEADELPMVLLDLSRTGTDTPWLLDVEADPPRVLLSTHPQLAALVADRLRARSESGRPPAAHTPRLTVTSAGLELGPVLRTAFRDAAPSGPDAFTADGTTLRSWLLECLPPGAPAGVARYLAAIRATRPDLVAAFPAVPGDDAPGLREWALRHGTTEREHDADLLTAAAGVGGNLPEGASTVARTRIPGARRLRDAVRSLGRRRDRPRTSGVNLVGYLAGELGIGQSARQVRAALLAAHVPVATETISLRLTSRQEADQAVHEALGHDMTLLCVNAAQTAAVTAASGGLWSGSHRIGYWYWEIETFPASEHGGFDHVDEVWVATDFVRDAIAPHANVPVVTLTPPLWRDPPASPIGRRELGLPEDRPVVLFVFDYLSTAERKNPWGAVEAFRRAVAPITRGGEGDVGGDDVTEPGRPLLVLKSINGDRRPRDAERLRLLAAGDPDIRLLEDYQSADDVAGLMGCCDVYLSLHRSEGLGLTIADAMSLGKPVVATAYGGNMEFMDDATGYLVPWSPVGIPEGCPPYPVGAVWADPDLDAAARLLQMVLADPGAASLVGQRAADSLREGHSAPVAGHRMERRLEEIRAGSRSARSSPRRAGVGPGSAEHGRS